MSDMQKCRHCDDAKRLDRLESILQESPATEVFFAGLRHSAAGPVVAYQVELASSDGHARVKSGRTLREVLDATLVERANNFTGEIK